jgi:hypothetical protein
MGRNQKGHIYEASGAFFVRYYDNQIVDGQQKRVQRSHRLCDKDSRYYAANSRAVRLLRDAFMVTVNEQQANGKAPEPDKRVVDFWTKTYLRSWKSTCALRPFMDTRLYGSGS